MPAISPKSLLNNPRIPTLPAVAVRVLEMSRCDQTNLRELARVIENDQALAAKIIRTVNSSYYGLTSPCSTITQAIVYLGMNAVRSLALGFSLIKSVDGGGDYEVAFDYLSYWRRAIYSAAAARLIASRSRRCDPDEAFLVALVQDLGMIVLERALGDVYLQTIDLAGGDHEKLVAVERHSLETDHTVVGADLAERWHFHSRIIEAMRFHHDPSPPATVHELVRTVALARKAAGLADPERSAAALHGFVRHAKSSFGFSTREIRDLLERMTAIATELAWLLNVNVGEAPDMEGLLDHAEAVRVEQSIRTLRENESLCRVLRSVGPPAGEGGEGALDDEILRAAQDARSLALILCEVDDADAIAAIHGDGALSSLMLKCESMLQLGSCARVLRIGAARFAVVQPGADDLDAAKLAESFRSRLAAAPLSLCTGATAVNSVPVTASFGAATAKGGAAGNTLDPASLHHLAAQALEAAKAAGGNTVRLSTPALRSSRAA